MVWQNGLVAKNNFMEEKVITKKEFTAIEDVIEKLLSQLEIEGTFEVAPQEDRIDILIETKDSGMIIGYHGEMLESLQLVLSIMISKKINRFFRVSIEVDDYKKNRTEYLEGLAQSTKEKALSDNAEQVLYSLKPWERRIVHLMLQDDEQVTSESRGEGKDRVLVIKPKA